MKRRLLKLLVFGLFVVGFLASFSSRLSVPAAAAGQSVFGVNSHLGSRYPNFQTLDVPLQALEATGTGWAREEFQWGLVDETRSGTYNWGFLDKVIPDLSSNNISIIGLLNDAPGHAPPDIDGFTKFVRAAVERYQNEIHYWEVWNEPENPIYWSPTDAAAYARLLQSVSSVIKATDPNAKVLMAGMVPTHVDFLRAIAEHGAWDSFDILSLHPYVDPFTPETGQIGDGGDVSKVQAIVEQLGSKPIWATEYGWSTGPADRLFGGGEPVSEETQANYLVRGAVLLRSAGLEHILWYSFKDTQEVSGEPHNMYGMFPFDRQGTDYSHPKPSLAAFTALNEQLAGATPVGAIQVGEQHLVADFNADSTWTVGDPSHGSMTQSMGQGRNGTGAAQINYNFTSSGNDFVGFTPPEAIPIPGQPTQLGIWVNGNGSGHELKAWLEDAEGEVLQFRLGIVGNGGWRFVSTPINGQVLDWNRISGNGNLRLDFPVRLKAFVLDDNPDSETGSGTFSIDDLTALNGAYGVRFNRGSENVDVLWSLANQQINLPTNSRTATLVDRSGNETTVDAHDGKLTISLSESPVYLTHSGKETITAEPTSIAEPTEQSSEPTPTVSGNPSSHQPTPVVGPTADPSQLENCRTFVATGFTVCGRLLEYWNQNGGLPVFGYPITPQLEEVIEGQQLQVQWFQRNRLELHPENARPYDVLLGLLGSEAVNDQTSTAAEALAGNCYRIPTAQYDVCGAFLDAWHANGLDLNGDGRSGATEDENLALFGLPVSPPRTETLEGNAYTVQWFERARFEWHPETNPPTVLFGLLGNETLGK